MIRITLVLIGVLFLHPWLTRAMVVSPEKNAPVVTEYPEALKKAGVRKARCIFKDCRGIIWIGTEYGLYRFDGTNIDYFYHKLNNPGTIPENTVISICGDVYGNIWVGTLRGVARIRAYSLKCYSYYLTAGNFAGGFDNKVFADQQGSVWVGNSAGIWRLNKKRDLFEHVWRGEISGKQGAVYINCITCWKKDTLVAGTFAGLVLVNIHNFGYRRIEPAVGGFIATRVFVDSLHRIWVGTWGIGCVLSDIHCRSFRLLKWESEASPMHDANIVSGIIAGKDKKTLWLCTAQGLYRINNYLDTVHDIRLLPVQRTDRIRTDAMLADDDGYIWLAGASVSRFFAGPDFFKPFANLSGAVQDLQQLEIGGKQKLVVSAWYKSSGLTVFDQKTGAITYRQAMQKDEKLSAISGIAIDKYQRIWIPSFKGITVTNSNFRSDELHPVINIRNDILLKSKINAIHINRDTVWLACYKKGIELLGLNFHPLKLFTNNDGSGLKDNLVSRFFTDSRGITWLCGNTYLYEFIPGIGKFRSYDLSEEKGGFTVNDIAENKDHNLLVASTVGLFVFDPRTGKSSRINSPLVKENDVESVAVDFNDDIWYITREHLVYYQPKINHFTLFGREDGLHTSDDLQLLRTFNGKTFYLAESDRLITFSPQLAPKSCRPPVAYFHALQVNDSTLSLVPGRAKFVLNYKQNRVYFEFGAINYIKADQNLYRFRLYGIDERWVSATHNYTSYSNLAPGSYTMGLKVQNSAGIWSRSAWLGIVITPPFWGTWWFRAIAFVMLSVLLFFVIRFVVQRNLREKILTLEKEQAVERERNRIARDMHDDLGSGLTKIAILSELTKIHIENRISAATQLETISTVSRELVDSLQNIVWLLNPKNDSLESLALYIRRYVNNFFEAGSILPVFDFAGDTGHIRLSEEQRRNVFLVVKEACNNILKHADASSVILKLCLENGGLKLQVSDNGKGFDPENISRLSNGLRNMRNRIAQIGGDFEVLSTPGEGTVITVKIK